MRALAVATVLLLSSSLISALAEEAGKAPDSDQPQTVPVEPQRNPQQSEQSRKEDQERAGEAQVRRDWRAQRRDDDHTNYMDHNDGRMMGHDWDHRKAGRDWRMRRDDEDADRDRAGRDDYGRRYDEDRPRRRVKICFEYENGDEYCRYRD